MREYPGSNFKPKNEVEYFPSFDEALRVAKTRSPHYESKFGSWAGGVRSWEGYDKLVAEGWKDGAEKLAPHFDAAKLATMQTKGTKHSFDVAGYMPSVPRYVAGNPMNMRRKVKAMTSKAPIRVVVGIGSSGGVSTDYMTKRGTAIACLVMYLAVFRAVELQVTVALQDADDRGYYFPVINVSTKPIDLAKLAFTLAHPGAARGITYSLLNTSGGIGWGHINGKNLYHVRGAEYDKLVKPILGLKGDDLLIPDTSLEDVNVERDPALWARNYLKEHLGLIV